MTFIRGVGVEGTAGGTDCLSIGPGAIGTNEDLCVGDSATSTDVTGKCVVLGPDSSAAGKESVIIGNAANSPHPFGRVVVIGEGATSVRNASVVIGRNAVSTGVAGSLVLIGESATTANGGTVVVGASATAGNAGVAVGFSAIAGFDGTAVGSLANGSNRSVAVGTSATTVGFTYSLALGDRATATANSQAVFGSTVAPITDFQTGVTANGAALSIQSSSQIVDTPNGTSQSTTNLIPAGATVLSVTARVTTAVETDLVDVFKIGDSVVSSRYGLDVPGALGTTIDASTWLADPAGVWSPSAREILVSTSGFSVFTGGSIRIVAHYTLPNPPTS